MIQAQKIIFVHLLNDYSGSPKVLSQVIRVVQKNGCETELYTGKSKDGFLSGVSERHHHYFYKRFENKYFTFATFILSQVILFFKLLKHRNEDVVIYVNTMLPFGAGLAGGLMGKPVYYHVHETSLTPASFKHFLRFIIRKTASKVIFVSQAIKEVEFFEKLPQQVVYNALPANFMSIALKSKYRHLIDEKFNVIMICSLKAYKGVDEIVEVACLCQNTSHIKFTLVLNADQSEIDAYFQEKILPSNLELVSRQKDLVPFYAKTSLLLNLSRVDQWVETFGLTIVEAMAFGVPVIVPPVGGPAEIVRNGKEGYLISSYDTERVAKIIIELSQDEEKYMFLSKTARKRAEDFKESLFEKKIIEAICE